MVRNLRTISNDEKYDLCMSVFKDMHKLKIPEMVKKYGFTNKTITRFVRAQNSYTYFTHVEEWIKAQHRMGNISDDELPIRLDNSLPLNKTAQFVLSKRIVDKRDIELPNFDNSDDELDNSDDDEFQEVVSIQTTPEEQEELTTSITEPYKEPEEIWAGDVEESIHTEVFDFSIANLLKFKRRTHYLKYVIRNDVSIRYHEVFHDKPELVGKYILKDHAASKYQVLDTHLAESIIAGNNVDNVVEVYGYLDGKEYKKIIKETPDGEWFVRNEEALDDINHERLSKELWTQTADNNFIRIIGKYQFFIGYNNQTECFLVSFSSSGEIGSVFKETTYEAAVKIIQENSNIRNKVLYIPLQKTLLNNPILNLNS